MPKIVKNKAVKSKRVKMPMMAPGNSFDAMKTKGAVRKAKKV